VLELELLTLDALCELLLLFVKLLADDVDALDDELLFVKLLLFEDDVLFVCDDSDCDELV